MSTTARLPTRPHPPLWPPQSVSTGARGWPGLSSPQAAVLWGHFLSRPGPARGRFTLRELRSPRCVAPGGLPSGLGLRILPREVGRVKKLFPEAPAGQGRLVQGGRRGVWTVSGRDGVAGLSASSRGQGQVPRPCPRADATLGTGGRGRAGRATARGGAWRPRHRAVVGPGAELCRRPWGAAGGPERGGHGGMASGASLSGCGGSPSCGPGGVGPLGPVGPTMPAGRDEGRWGARSGGEGGWVLARAHLR